MDDPSLTKWLAAVRAIHFASCLLIGTVWAFDRLIVTGSSPAWRRIAIYLLAIFTPAALVSGAAWFILVAADMSGLPIATSIHNTDVLETVWSQTRFGHAWIVHLYFWCAGLVMDGIWVVTRRGGWAGLAMAAGLVGGLAWAGHGSTGPAPTWHMSADVVHLLASSVWPAGLVPFVLLLNRIARSNESGRWNDLFKLTRRFSAVSLLSVGLLTITGLIESYCLLGSFHALVTTDYGKILLIKLTLFAGMVGLGAFNLLVLKPRLPAGGLSFRHLRINVMVEIALGMGIVIAVGLLGLLEPARQ